LVVSLRIDWCLERRARRPIVDCQKSVLAITALQRKKEKKKEKKGGVKEDTC